MITIEEVEKLCQLARIRLDEKEKKEIAHDLGAILKYVDEIKKATPNMDLKPEAGQNRNVFREDTARMTSKEDREALLAEAPDREGDFIAVKKIF